MPNQLTEDAHRRARSITVRYAYTQASNEELAAIDQEYQDEWALLQGDVREGVASQTDILHAHIAYVEWHLESIKREMARRLRAQVFKPGATPAADWTARFDAMRRESIVEGLGLLGVELTKRGNEWKARCPFHTDRSPSFSVSQQKNLWICYSCQRGGDLVEFVVLREGKSRGEALVWLETMMGSVAAGEWNRPAMAGHDAVSP